MKKLFLTSIAACLLTLIDGCAGGGGYGGGGYGYGGATSQSTAAIGSAAGNAVGGGMTGAIANAIIQNMAASVLNGQIGSQLTPTDQNFRLQQLNGAAQSGSFNQAQQWVNPQTGNAISLTPVGQQIANPANGQTCRTMEEVVTLQSGQTLRETRRACQNASGQWILVQ